MIGRIFLFLTLTVALQSAAIAADFGWPMVRTGKQSVPGADVTIESGVRVIRPVPFDPAWVVDEKTRIPGGVVYRGAAFYRVPSKAAHKPMSEKLEKPHAE